MILAQFRRLVYTLRVKTLWGLNLEWKSLVKYSLRELSKMYEMMCKCSYIV